MSASQENMVGAIFMVVLAAVGVARTVTSKPFHVPGPAADAQRHSIYEEGAEKEPGERQGAARRFRYSPWSQDDDFHNQESKRVKNFAKNHDVTVTSLLEGLDDGMRQHWPTPTPGLPNPRVQPCRPRLMY
jgi:hypothetical protein